MSFLALLLFLFAAAPPPEQLHFRYQRPVIVAPGAAPQACTVLGADLFAHASGSLADLRLYNGAAEEPYALTMSEAATPTDDPATVQNLGSRSGHIVFDLQMPARSYTSVDLGLAAKDFLATAKVSTPSGTQLGEFTLFDLTAQHLSRSTTLALAESTFPRLHVELTLTPAPGTPAQSFAPSIVTGASVPPSREAQTLYTPVAEVTSFTHRDRKTIAELHIPARVPVERVAFRLPPEFKANFSRPVQITAYADKSPNPAHEVVSGEISRVHLDAAGHPVREQLLTVPATLGANLQSDATVQVAIDDGDDHPLPLAAVHLEMRQRQLCFDPGSPSRATAQPVLFYGDPDLHAPVYDYARLFTPSAAIRTARLAPEQVNPAFTPRADTRPFTERHPELLWIVLLAVIGVLSGVAFRAARRLPR
ncbi:hypothetical protein FTO74_03275 [Granulicella sp. WH15]|uniref:hypothetical protein n=1 Tax=Granulicella sp. WH15 TaxID=2602070 RepID=UPI00136786E7|nr:hypothetical protein [Granulicella sp. WH15]QHN02504.1 hypothetical protein FTO74_03275 [Granulicella sp. WH15]